DLPSKRKALLSSNYGWRSYPCEFLGSLEDGKEHYCIKFQVSYSSTCPCSAALARQVVQKQFHHDFANKTHLTREEMIQWLGQETSITATPHGQRSHANVTIYPRKADSLNIESFIDLV